MGKYILADNQELTRFALEALIRQKGNHDIYNMDFADEQAYAAIEGKYPYLEHATADVLLCHGGFLSVKN